MILPLPHSSYIGRASCSYDGDRSLARGHTAEPVSPDGTSQTMISRNPGFICVRTIFPAPAREVNSSLPTFHARATGPRYEVKHFTKLHIFRKGRRLWGRAAFRDAAG